MSRSAGVMGLTVGMNERGGEGVCCPKKNSISSSSTGGVLRSSGLKVRRAQRCLRRVEWLKSLEYPKTDSRVVR